VSSPTGPHRPTPSHTVPRRPLSSSVVPCRPLPSPAVFRCFPMLSAVFRRPPPSPAVQCSYLPSPGRSCLRSWGSSSLLMTAVLGIKGRGRTTFCRPVSSGGLGSPSAGPYGGPGRLRTLVNPNQLDSSGNTPLLCAARNGYQGVVKILLERDEVNPDEPDNCGQTPLHKAAWGGHQEVVKILLAREEVNPDKLDNHSSTPLSVAAQY